MDWLERTIGIGWDGGNGSLELSLIIVLAFVVGLGLSVARGPRGAWMPRQ
jgi:hypothetical protein